MCFVQVFMDFSEKELSVLADVFTGVANGRRLAILFGLDAGMSMPEVAEYLGVERGALQRHIDILVRSELVYRPSDSRAYALTSLGEFVVELVDESSDEILGTLADLDEIRSALSEDMPDWVDDRGRTLHTESWERIVQQE